MPKRRGKGRSINAPPCFRRRPPTQPPRKRLSEVKLWSDDVSIPDLFFRQAHQLPGTHGAERALPVSCAGLKGANDDDDFKTDKNCEKAAGSAKLSCSLDGGLLVRPSPRGLIWFRPRKFCGLASPAQNSQRPRRRWWRMRRAPPRRPRLAVDLGPNVCLASFTNWMKRADYA